MRVDITHNLETKNFRVGNGRGVLRSVIKIAYQVDEDKVKNILERLLGKGLVLVDKLGDCVFNELGYFAVLKDARIASAVVLRDIFQAFRKGLASAGEGEKVVFKAGVFIRFDGVDVAGIGQVNIPRVDDGILVVCANCSAAACYHRQLEPVKMWVRRDNFRRLAVSSSKL